MNDETKKALELAREALQRGSVIKDTMAIAAIDAALSAPAAPVAQGEPVAWVRWCTDGTYEGPIMDSRMEPVRKTSGAWTPLYAAPATPVAQPLTDEQVLRDAERYRKLRNASMDERNRLEHFAGTELDKAIDAHGITKGEA